MFVFVKILSVTKLSWRKRTSFHIHVLTTIINLPHELKWSEMWELSKRVNTPMYTTMTRRREDYEK